MNGGFPYGPAFLWCLLLSALLPLAVVVLGEWVHRLERRSHPLTGPVKEVRNLLLPSLAVDLLVRQVLELGDDSLSARITATLLWIVLIHSVLSILDGLLFADAEESSWHARVPALLRDLSRLLMVAVGAAIVLSQVWGFELGRLLAALGVGSLVLGLALQDTLGNMFSGVTLLFERPLRVGDWLEVNGKVGRVLQINWRALHLKTLDAEFLIIPNLVLSKQMLTNYSYPTPSYFECMEFSFSYQDPPNQVKRVLSEVARDLPLVLPEPPPFISTEGFEENQIRYKLKFCLPGYEHSDEVRDEISTRLWYAAKRNGLELEPSSDFPEVLRFETRPATPVQSAEEPRPIESRLAYLPCFRNIQAPVLQEIAAMTRTVRFGVGEILIRQGETGMNFFILTNGRVTITHENERGESLQLALLGPGDFFGEMSLLLNEASSATVSAIEDVEVLCISRSDLHRLLEWAPELARTIGRAIEDRRARDLRASRHIGA